MADPPPAHAVTGPLAITVLVVGLIAWPLAFNLGAYGTVLYDDVFTLVVA